MASRSNETIDQSWTRSGGEALGRTPTPGVVLLFSGSEAWLRAVPLVDGGLTLGRDDVGGHPLDDARLSRRHLTLRLDGARWEITDHDSRNGTFVDGEPISGTTTRAVADAPLVRAGDSIFWLLDDVGPYLGRVVEHQARALVGPTLRRVWDAIAEAARHGDSVFITGESGSGKELAARHFAAAGPRHAGPFVAVNCATIPANLAERLLFGAKKGAYSGADADVEGYVQAAHGGTLFLDELGELDLLVQAKLLRVLESREVVALGAAKPRKVDLALVAATHRDLRALVAEGKFREDLFFRIARPAVELPPLRARRDEIPWLIQRTLSEAGSLPAHVSLVESCLLRPWPGNVRELLVEIKAAHALAARNDAKRVEAQHLGPTAGQPFSSPALISSASASDDGVPEAPARRPARSTEAVSEQQVRAALDQHAGNVTRAARALGWHRNQLRRWLDKHKVEGAAEDDPSDS